MINNINACVREHDILINLGDFVFRQHKLIPQMREEIRCRQLHHIIGNHDQHIEKYARYFSSVSDMMQLSYHGNVVILSHYAMRVWPGMYRGYYHCYGHSHDSLDRPPNLAWGKSMDVGIDSAYRHFGHYRPFHIKEVMDILKKRKGNIPSTISVIDEI